MAQKKQRIQGNRSRVHAILGSAVAACALANSPASATVLYWDGSSSNSWSTAANWDTSGSGGVNVGALIPGATDDVIFNASGAITNNLGTLGANQAAGSITVSSGATVVLNNNNLTLGAGGLTVNLGATSVTGNTNWVLGAGQAWTNNAGITMTQSGAVSLGANALSISGSGNTTLTGVVSGAGSVSKNGNGTLSLLNAANTFAGGFSLNSGTVIFSTSTSAFGSGTLTLAGGIIRTNDVTSRTVVNALAITGSTQFGVTPTNGNQLYTNVTQSISNAPTLTFETRTTTFSTGVMQLNSNVGLVSANGGLGQFQGGFNLNGADRTITFTGATAHQISGPLSSTAGGNKLILAGTGLATVGTVTAGANNPSIEVNGSGTFTFNGASTFTQGVQLTSGTLVLAGAQVGTTSITSGPIGTGPLTLAGGIIRTDNTNRAYNNSVAITGDFQFNTLAGNNNSLTLDVIGSLTTPNTITLSGNRTITSMLNTLTLNGPIAGISTPSLSIKGPGTVALTNATATASTFGNVSIGDSVASGSIGGRLNVNSQNAMGSGTTYTINYGGMLNPNANFSPSNVITVNTGGTYATTGATAGINMAAGSSFASGSTLQNSSGQTLTITAANVALPTSGVLFNNSSNAVSRTGAFATPTGTLSFGGTGTQTISSTAATEITANTTLAFNQTGGGAVSFNGLSLSSGNLTVAGTGNTGLAGAGIPQGNAGGLGAITSSGTKSVTVALAATGAVSMTPTASGFTGGLNITSGTLSVDGGNTAGNKAGGSIFLNGGTIRNGNAGNNAAGWQDAIAVGPAGGTIESFSGGNIHTVSFSGPITSSGALTLRYGGTPTDMSSIILAPTSASSFSGAITLATTSGRGFVQFNNNSLAGVASGSVTVPAGVVFAVDTLSTLTGNIAKFVTNSDSILALDTLAASNIDLSSGGINRNIRIGNRNSITYSGTLTSHSGTYNFTPGGGQTLTFASALSGGAALDVRAGANAPGAYGVATGTLAFTTAQTFTGATTINGTVLNSLGGGGVTSPTVTLGTAGELSGTSSITVDRGATLTLASGTNTGASGASLIVRGGAAINVNSASALRDDVALTLGGVNGGGGYGSAVSQTLAKLTVATGNSTRSGVGVLTLSDAGATVYTRNAGGILNITAATVQFSNTPTTNVSGQLLVGAYFNNVDFYQTDGTVASDLYTAQNAAGSWLAGQTINTPGAITGTTTTNLAINALRATNGGTATIFDTLTISSGMIMVAGNGPAITGGNITSGNSQDLIVHMTGGNSSIASRITGGLAFTLGGPGGTGNFTLSNSNNDITGINVHSNRLFLSNAGAWGNAAPINISGGVLGYTANTDKTLTSAFTVNIGSGGGTFLNSGTGTLTVDGAVTLNGSMAVVGVGGQDYGNGTLNLKGALSGDGVVAVGTSGNRTRVLFSNANNSGWTGGLLSRNDGNGSATSNIFAFNANSLGTGPIVLNRAANLYFDTNAAGATALNQTIAHNSNSTISFFGLGSGLSTSGGTAPLTLNGQLIGSGGLTFQGTATADNQVSEVILKNTVSTSGTPTAYSFGTATSAQNFVNSQGGIQLGVTGFKGVTSNNLTDRVEDGSGANSEVLNGALGFVRFDGAKSFIQGAVGPGYISSLRKAGSGQNGRFGYLVTGGSTYALPEGKSFVIGSLGTGASVGGTLGSTGTGTNTAILTGSPKLAGFAAGDVNIHANGVNDNQSLNLLARNAGDTFQVGTSTTAVVFAPTYGDSGITSAVTLMSARTGGTTTINKIGAGTVDFQNALFNNVNGATNSAKGSITLNVDGGTLRYTQVDTGTSYSAVNVNNGGTLGGNGSINGNVVVNTGGTIAPGNSNGKLTVNGNFTLGAGTMAIELSKAAFTQPTQPTAGTDYDQLVATGSTVSVNSGILSLNFGDRLENGDVYYILDNQGASAIGGLFSSGLINGAAASITPTGGSLYTFAGSGYSFILNYADQFGGAEFNDISLTATAVPEPASLGLIGLAAAGLMTRRKRRKI